MSLSLISYLSFGNWAVNLANPRCNYLSNSKPKKFKKIRNFHFSISHSLKQVLLRVVPWCVGASCSHCVVGVFCYVAAYDVARRDQSENAQFLCGGECSYISPSPPLSLLSFGNFQILNVPNV